MTVTSLDKDLDNGSLAIVSEYDLSPGGGCSTS